MKKLLLCLILLIGFSIHGMAQNYTEVVYLKNGSMIKGTIVEQIPNESLKIKTSDGSLFVFQLSEVAKITKEETITTTTTTTATSLDAYRMRKEARKTLKGYKGFVDAGYTFGVDDYDYSFDNTNKFEVSTTHGYQFNNYFFVGGGVALNYYTDADVFSVPIYTNFRANFINKKITPFGDVKVGYSAGDISGTYVSLGIGVRFTMAKKSAINLRLEYTAQGYESYYYRYGYGSYYEEDVMSGVGFKIGVEF